MPEPVPPPRAAAPAGDEPLRQPGSCGELFQVFNRLALQGFGGVLPLAHHALVERERWLSNQGFVELLALAQVLPGPNVVNLALMLGDRWFGWRGAVAAAAGLMLAPMLGLLVLATLLLQVRHLPQVDAALRGMGAVAAGLVLGTGLKLARTLRHNPLGLPIGLAVAALTLAAVGMARWPMVSVVLGFGTVVVSAAAWRLHQTPVAGR